MRGAALLGTQKIAFQMEGVVPGLPPLVLLHGFCEDLSMWDQWITGLSGIGSIRIDLPGFGQSDLPSDNSLTAYAAAVKAVLDQVSIGQCILVGHSMGGYTALAFAEQWPERVVGLGLFHSHPFADNPAQQHNRDRGVELIESGKRDLYVAQLFPNLFSAEFKRLQPDLVESRIFNGQTQSVEGIVAALKSMRNRPDRSEVLRALGCPVLFLIGQQDALIPYERALTTTLLPSWAVVHLLRQVAHMGMYEEPEVTARLVAGYYWQCVHLTKPKL